MFVLNYEFKVNPSSILLTKKKLMENMPNMYENTKKNVTVFMTTMQRWQILFHSHVLKLLLIYTECTKSKFSSRILSNRTTTGVLKYIWNLMPRTCKEGQKLRDGVCCNPTTCYGNMNYASTFINFLNGILVYDIK